MHRRCSDIASWQAHSSAWSIAASELSLPRTSEQHGSSGKALLISLGSSQQPREAESIVALGYDLERHDAAVVGRGPFEDEWFDLVVDKCGLDSLARAHSSEVCICVCACARAWDLEDARF